MATTGGCALAGDAPPQRPTTRLPVSASAPHVPNQVLVQFRPGTDAERVQVILAGLGVSASRALGTPLAYVLTAAPGTSAEELLARVRAVAEIEHASLNYLARPLPGGASPAR